MFQANKSTQENTSKDVKKEIQDQFPNGSTSETSDDHENDVYKNLSEVIESCEEITSLTREKVLEISERSDRLLKNLQQLKEDLKESRNKKSVNNKTQEYTSNALVESDQSSITQEALNNKPKNINGRNLSDKDNQEIDEYSGTDKNVSDPTPLPRARIKNESSQTNHSTTKLKKDVGSSSNVDNKAQEDTSNALVESDQSAIAKEALNNKPKNINGRNLSDKDNQEIDEYSGTDKNVSDPTPLPRARIKNESSQTNHSTTKLKKDVGSSSNVDNKAQEDTSNALVESDQSAIAKEALNNKPKNINGNNLSDKDNQEVDEYSGTDKNVSDPTSLTRSSSLSNLSPPSTRIKIESSQTNNFTIETTKKKSQISLSKFKSLFNISKSSIPSKSHDQDHNESIQSQSGRMFKNKKTSYLSTSTPVLTSLKNESKHYQIEVDDYKPKTRSILEIVKQKSTKFTESQNQPLF